MGTAYVKDHCQQCLASANVYLKSYVWVLIWFLSPPVLGWRTPSVHHAFQRQAGLIMVLSVPDSNDKRDTMLDGQEKHFRPWAGFTLEPGYRISHLCEEKEMNRKHYYPTCSSPPFLSVVHSLYLITKWGYVSFAVKQLFYNSNKMFYISLIMVSRCLRPR